MELIFEYWMLYQNLQALWEIRYPFWDYRIASLWFFMAWKSHAKAVTPNLERSEFCYNQFAVLWYYFKLVFCMGSLFYNQQVQLSFFQSLIVHSADIQAFIVYFESDKIADFDPSILQFEHSIQVQVLFEFSSISMSWWESQRFYGAWFSFSHR